MIDNVFDKRVNDKLVVYLCLNVDILVSIGQWENHEFLQIDISSYMSQDHCFILSEKQGQLIHFLGLSKYMNVQEVFSFDIGIIREVKLFLKKEL